MLMEPLLLKMHAFLELKDLKSAPGAGLSASLVVE